MWRFLRFLTLSLVVAQAGLAQAQAEYPTKPIRFICPFAAGGAADLVSRLIASQLSSRLGREVVVENRTGANGNIGTQLVAQSDPDGHVLLLGFDGTLVINPNLYSRLPFDPVADFIPVGKIGDVPLLIIANPAVQARNIAELVALSKAQSSGLAYGTAGTGSTQHIMFELLKLRSGGNFVHAPYKGAAPAMVDVMGGHLPLVGAALAGSLDNIRAGKLRALAVSTETRLRHLPDIPTLSESGFSDLVITAWHGVMVPAKTPRTVVNRLNAELNAALRDPAVIERLDSLGSIAAPGTAEKFADIIKRDLARYAQVIKAAGLKAD